MRNKAQIKTFNDGIVDIHSETKGEELLRYDGIRYANEVMGATRFYAAAAANIKINRVISIPCLKGIEPEMVFEITEDRQGVTGKYSAVEVQTITETAKPYLKIVLRAYAQGKTDWEEDYGL